MPHRAKHKRIYGDWTVASFTSGDMLQLVWLVIVLAIVRGYDYGTGGESITLDKSLSLVESAAPFWVWSLVLIVGGLTLTTGVLLHRHSTVWAGHAILAAAYTTLWFGLMIPTLARPYADGIRAAMVLAVVAFVHWKFVQRTGVRPIRPDEATRDEIITKG